MSVSRNTRDSDRGGDFDPSTPVGPPRGWAVLLRAVGLHIPAGPMLYVAAGLLKRGRNKEDRAYNKGITDLVACLLEVPNTNTEMIDHVLRHLPDTIESETDR